ncbi:MAG TPA: hypothetical protein VG675_07405 [Bryobacteraceae bacterium]|nr:hypothetical protein [Bryobacteraceae bacterium]
MNKLLLVLALNLAAECCLSAQVNVLMNRYDRFMTGANTHETALNASNVKAESFGKLYSYYIDGPAYAQPLYVSGVRIPKRGTHNVLYVATMNDKVYAFDAEKSGPPLWMRDLTNERLGVTPVPITDITNNNGLNVVGNVGIESTPVIDLAANAIYVLARTRENTKYVQRLHKLDLRDGRDLVPPAVIEAAVKSTAKDAVDGVLHFDPKAGNQRTALALVDGMIVIAWASHEDIQPYHGWIMAYDAAKLKQTAALCMSPDGVEGGIWQSGRGPAVDSSGVIYYEVGNGTWDGKRNFGNSLLKLRVHGGALEVEDYFTPHDYERLNVRDADLGSTGPLLIPNTNALIGGSKMGALYLFDTENLRHLTPDDTGIRQTVAVNGGRVLAGPAFWDGPDGPVLYLWCEADFLKGFRFNGHLLDPVPFAKGSISSHGSPGGALTVSANGKQAPSGVVWAALTNGRSADHGNAAGVLRAFSAGTLEEIWNSEQQPKRDRLGTLVKFVPPTVAAGRVYVPNYDNAVNVYGLLTKETVSR